MMGIGLFAKIAGGFSGIVGYVRTHRWARLALIALALVGVGWWIGRARAEQIYDKAVSLVTTTFKTEQTILANANIIVTATGGVTKIALDANGMPTQITNEGGSLHVQANVTKDQRTTGEAATSASVETEHKEIKPRDSWKYVVEGGPAFGPEKGYDLGAGARVGSFLGADVGVMAGARAPQDLAGIKDLGKRGTFSVKLIATF